jgi:phage terminase small subunit
MGKGERMTKPLPAKRQRFVEEYLIDLNATQAAIRAGYSAKTAGSIGEEILKKPEIQEAIQAAMKARSERTEITADRVLKELGRIAFFDIRKLYNDDGTLKKPNELDDEAAAVVSGVDVVEMQTGEKDALPLYTKKVKVNDKIAALTNAMKHLGMFVEKHELTGRDGKDLMPEAPKGVLVVPGVLNEADWEKMMAKQGGKA